MQHFKRNWFSPKTFFEKCIENFLPIENGDFGVFFKPYLIPQFLKWKAAVFRILLVIRLSNNHWIFFFDVQISFWDILIFPFVPQKIHYKLASIVYLIHVYKLLYYFPIYYISKLKFIRTQSLLLCNRNNILAWIIKCYQTIIILIALWLFRKYVKVPKLLHGYAAKISQFQRRYMIGPVS